MLIWQIIFWFCVLCLMHSYIFYPLILNILSGNKKIIAPQISEPDQPMVSVIMSVYNEEKVLEKKIKTVFTSNYPSNKLELVIGSDGSTDNTDFIIEKFIQEGYQIRFKKFGGRSGKSNIINALIPEVKGQIFILTDANILFDENTIPFLVRHFKNEKIGLVGANVINTGLQKEGISFQEETYIRRENKIKYQEGLIWGTMMGAFGACYAIRAELFGKIPKNFLMEDFYITLGVIRSKKLSISDPEAKVYEDVSNLVKEEFKRKIRISAGNFQNLGVYYGLLKNPFSGAGFSFLSHKVLRWKGPFFLIVALISTAFLLEQNLFYKILFFLQLLGFISPLIDRLLSSLNIHNFALRLLAYFYMMNLALLLGFVKWVRGIKTNTWNPTQRNVE